MPWREFFIPIDPDDHRNADRQNPGGERIRVRLAGSSLDDFVVQYETPLGGSTWRQSTRRPRQSHAVVLRSDGTHAPHYDVYDRFGNQRTIRLPSDLTAGDVVDRTIGDIRQRWRELRRIYYRGLP